MDQLRERKSMWRLSTDEVKDLKKAFQGILSLEPENKQSYMALAGQHGIPTFFCAHNSQFFLFWHRAYIHAFEDALRSIVPTVTLPYWDVMSEEGRNQVYPDWFKNDPFWNGFDTAPFLSPEAQKDFRAYLKNAGLAKTDLTSWRAGIDQTRTALNQPSLMERFEDAMNSKTWYEICKINALESPHGAVHIAAGGWMSRVQTAAFDPIFWFHHCNVERLFYLWQFQNNFMTVKALEANKGKDDIPWDTDFSTLEGWMNPFSWAEPYKKAKMTGTFTTWIFPRDVMFTHGSFSDPPSAPMLFAAPNLSREATASHTTSGKASLMVKNINRAKIEGSFFVKLSVGNHTEEIPVFQGGVGCPNCVENPLLSVKASMPLSWFTENTKVSINAVVRHPETGAETDVTSEIGQPTFNVRPLFLN